MFTGIIKELGTIAVVQPLDGGRELQIRCGMAKHISVDESISINGACHTATAVSNQAFTVQSVEETLRKTTIGNLKAGDKVNLERSLRPDQLLDGHLVQGHVDGLGTVERITREGTDWLFTIRFDAQFNDLIVGRGSITINGISLTVADDAGDSFTVAIIPYTYEHTNLQHVKEGEAVNLEFDVIGKYVAKFMQNRAG